jgi:hypothetical protein
LDGGVDDVAAFQEEANHPWTDGSAGSGDTNCLWHVYEILCDYWIW